MTHIPTELHQLLISSFSVTMRTHWHTPIHACIHTDPHVRMPLKTIPCLAALLIQQYYLHWAAWKLNTSQTSTQKHKLQSIITNAVSHFM